MASKKITKAPSGKSFMYVPPAAPKRTLCPKCNKGHVIWVGGSQNYTFKCSKCPWNSKPLQSGGKRKKFVPAPLRQPKESKREPWVPSFVSETKTTITIRHADGEILTVRKTTYAEVVARLKAEKKAMKFMRKAQS